MRTKLIFLLHIFLLPYIGLGQVSVPGSFFQSIDIFNDSSALTFHTSVSNTTDDAFNLLDPRTRISYNSNYPRGLNDGPVWKGKGLTTEVHFGVNGQKGAFSYTFYPVLFYSQSFVNHYEV